MRLLTKQSSLSFKVMDKDFMKHSYFKVMLNKTKRLASIKFKLPPLKLYEKEKTKSTKKLLVESADQNKIDEDPQNEVVYQA